MSDQTADDGIEAVEDDAGAKKGGSKKKLLMIAGPILALVLVGAGAYLGGAMDMLAGDEAPAEAEVHQPVFYDLPDMLVNLNGTGRKLSFLKLNVSLELAKPEDEAKKSPQVITMSTLVMVGYLTLQAHFWQPGGRGTY